jgi:hypothetical protein
VNEITRRPKPHVAWRLLIILALVGFAMIENNPVVRLEAFLGLSPSPLERFFGIKSLFSGMTEGVHQFVRLNLAESIRANLFAPLVVPLLVFLVVTWRFPKIDSKQKEAIFFLGFIGLSVVVNIVN